MADLFFDLKTALVAGGGRRIAIGDPNHPADVLRSLSWHILCPLGRRKRKKRQGD